jgi:GT2 family glycosyltransferase
MPVAIASLTVSMNARDLVGRQVAQLAAQSPRLAEIIVVDNASCDGTAEMLARDFPDVTLIQLATNEGIAGASAAGLEYAVFERGHEWVWTLDGDSAPGQSTLGELIAALESASTRSPIGVLAPVPVHEESGAAYPGLEWRDGLAPAGRRDDSGDVEFVDAVISSGSLVSAAAIRAAGLPRRDFFMDFVDFELCLRIRRAGFLVGVVRGSTMSHAIGAPHRVTELGVERVRARHQPWREYYKTRNLAFTVWHEFPSAMAKWHVVARTLRHALGVLLYDPEKRRRLALIARGLRDGVNGKLGRQVKPDAGPDLVRAVSRKP